MPWVSLGVLPRHHLRCGARLGRGARQALPSDGGRRPSGRLASRRALARRGCCGPGAVAPCAPGQAARPVPRADHPLHPLPHRLEHDIEHRDHEDADQRGRRSCRRTPACPPRGATASPRPLAITSGTRPRMKAIEVIITARKRSRAPMMAASRMRQPCLALLLGEFDDQDAVLGGQRDQHHQADLRVDVERHQRRRPRCATKAPSTPTATDSSTGTGMIQLSYSATRNR